MTTPSSPDTKPDAKDEELARLDRIEQGIEFMSDLVDILRQGDGMPAAERRDVIYPQLKKRIKAHTHDEYHAVEALGEFVNVIFGEMYQTALRAGLRELLLDLTQGLGA